MILIALPCQNEGTKSSGAFPTCPKELVLCAEPGFGVKGNAEMSSEPLKLSMHCNCNELLLGGCYMMLLLAAETV